MSQRIWYQAVLWADKTSLNFILLHLPGMETSIPNFAKRSKNVTQYRENAEEGGHCGCLLTSLTALHILNASQYSSLIVTLLVSLLALFLYQTCSFLAHHHHNHFQVTWHLHGNIHLTS